jgi:hypothetical protein
MFEPIFLDQLCHFPTDLPGHILQDVHHPCLPDRILPNDQVDFTQNYVLDFPMLWGIVILGMS